MGHNKSHKKLKNMMRSVWGVRMELRHSYIIVSISIRKNINFSLLLNVGLCAINNYVLKVVLQPSAKVYFSSGSTLVLMSIGVRVRSKVLLFVGESMRFKQFSYEEFYLGWRVG